MESAGGSCHVSSTNNATHTTAILSGTTNEFLKLTDNLNELGSAFGEISARIRSSVAQSSPSSVGNCPWSEQTALMGILNVTPDSFHDGGEFEATDAAVTRAEEMVEQGADIIDVGGEATNPDVDATATDVEIDRVVPVIERISKLDAWISVDTRKSEVAAAALQAGADIVNDVPGLADPALPRVVADHDAHLVVMHSVNVPVDRSQDISHDDVVSDMIGELLETVRRAEQAGVDKNKIIVDPGVGFGKTASESFKLVDRLVEMKALGGPIMLGHSRKSMFNLVNSYPDEDARATSVLTGLAVDRDVDIVRVHDVQENVTAIKTAERLRRS